MYTQLFHLALLVQGCLSLEQYEQQPIDSLDLLEITSHDKLSDVIDASRFLSLHRKLVQIESISDSEYNVGNYLKDILERHNFTITHQDIPHRNEGNSSQPRWNIYATPDPSKFGFPQGIVSPNTPKVLLSSHIDTVPPYIPYSLSVPKTKKGTYKREDILVSGRGTVDAKACVAAQITAVSRLLHDPSFEGHPSDLALLFVVGEEVSGDGMLHFSDSKLYRDTKSQYKAIIFGEPTESKLAIGHKGIIQLRITAKGKAAHSGYPWLGRSANSMLLPALMKLDTLGAVPEDMGGFPNSELFGNTTVNVGYIQGGVAANVVPEHAEAKIAFRLAAGTAEQNRQIIRKAIKSVDPDDLLELDFSQGYGPVHLDDDVPGFDTITVNYGTDVPNINVDTSVKRYLFGPGSILVAHGANEGLTVGELESAVDDYERLIKHALTL